MKATELMVGDWVKSISPCKILSISEHRIELYDDTPDYDYEGYKFGIDKKYFNDIKPIPLTAEILEKNGWKEYPQVYSNQKTINFDIYRFEDEVGVKIQGYCMVLKYVHEFQRVLRCCGLWDLAENFKI